jgi:hypothetical protein
VELRLRFRPGLENLSIYVPGTEGVARSYGAVLQVFAQVKSVGAVLVGNEHIQSNSGCVIIMGNAEREDTGDNVIVR